MRRVPPPIDRRTGKSAHADVSGWTTCNTQAGERIMRAAGLVWNPWTACFEAFYAVGLNAVDGAMDYLFCDGVVRLQIHPTPSGIEPNYSEPNWDQAYVFEVRLGPVDWPTYLNNSELLVLLMLVDDDFRNMVHQGESVEFLRQQLPRLESSIRRGVANV